MLVPKTTYTPAALPLPNSRLRLRIARKYTGKPPASFMKSCSLNAFPRLQSLRWERKSVANCTVSGLKYGEASNARQWQELGFPCPKVSQLCTA